MAIFADLQYYSCWRRLVDFSKKNQKHADVILELSLRKSYLEIDYVSSIAPWNLVREISTTTLLTAHYAQVLHQHTKWITWLVSTKIIYLFNWIEIQIMEQRKMAEIIQKKRTFFLKQGKNQILLKILSLGIHNVLFLV